MKKRKFALFAMVIFILVCIFLGKFSTPTYAEVNFNYGEKAEVDTSSSDTKADSGGLLGLLASGVLGFGKLLQIIVALLMNLLSLSNGKDFPWADRIIFNTIPILDVNFINPAKGSFFLDSSGTRTTIGEVVSNIYFTGMSIALGFLSIVVAVMAIKLAISSIAAEKAKYKEAIVTWLTALVLLFGMHFLLSFIFYLNEKLVEVASQIVVDATASTGLQIGNKNVNTGAVVSGLGEYYSTKATEGASGWLAVFETKPIPAVLFTIFVVQSIMFLFAYFKRFFYVIILSLLAPYVVIYDFFRKAI